MSFPAHTDMTFQNQTDFILERWPRYVVLQLLSHPSFKHKYECGGALSGNKHGKNYQNFIDRYSLSVEKRQKNTDVSFSICE